MAIKFKCFRSRYFARLFIIVLTFTSFCGAFSSAFAVDIAIQFTAIIDQFDGDPNSIPTELVVGDTITTTYTFAANDFADDDFGAVGSQVLTLGEAKLESSNSAQLVLNMGLLVPPINPPDTLFVSCFSPTDVFPSCANNRFPEDENLFWDSTLALFANTGTLSSLVDVRKISGLESIGGTGTLVVDISLLMPGSVLLERLLSVRASIIEIRVVPEPSAMMLILFPCVLFGGICRLK